MAVACEACGLVCGAAGGPEYVCVNTTNGGLKLCHQCLADINRKNPELKALKAAALPLAQAWVDYVRGDPARNRGTFALMVDADPLRELAALLKPEPTTKPGD